MTEIMQMATAISDYALLGDCHSASLVGRDGSIDWWCAPRFDSRSTFARLLDRGAGHWSIRPSEPFEVRREYLEDTMVLQSTFTTTSGVVALTDAMVLGPGRGHEIGLRAPHALVRRVDARSALEDTISAWRSWVANHSYDGAHGAHVRRSALVLQALTYQPTGAIVAAPTMSLPGDHRGGLELGLPLRLAARRERARPHRAPVAPPRRIPRLPARARRQRRLAPAPARRLRRGARGGMDVA